MPASFTPTIHRYPLSVLFQFFPTRDHRPDVARPSSTSSGQIHVSDQERQQQQFP